jgi:hypothetical protein
LLEGVAEPFAACTSSPSSPSSYSLTGLAETPRATKMRYTAVVAALVGAQTFALVGASRCHCLPGDACWPASSQWSALNTTVNGGLVATVPIGTPCHDPNYDEVACAALQSNWTLPQLQCAPRPANSIVFRYVPD